MGDNPKTRELELVCPLEDRVISDCRYLVHETKRVNRQLYSPNICFPEGDLQIKFLLCKTTTMVRQKNPAVIRHDEEGWEWRVAFHFCRLNSAG